MSEEERVDHPPELEALLDELERVLGSLRWAVARDAVSDVYDHANEAQRIRTEIGARFGGLGRRALGEPVEQAVPPGPPVDLAELLRQTQRTRDGLSRARATSRQAARDRAVRSETLAIGVQSQLARCPWCQKLVAGPGDDRIETEGQPWHRRCREKAGDLL